MPTRKPPWYTRVRWIFVFVLFLILIAIPGSLQAQDYVRESGPKLLSYDQLVQLNSDQEMSPELGEDLHLLTTTPFLNNEAYLAGARPKPLDIAGLGPSLRVVFWNIERGLELDYIELSLIGDFRISNVSSRNRHGGVRMNSCPVASQPGDASMSVDQTIDAVGLLLPEHAALLRFALEPVTIGSPRLHAVTFDYFDSDAAW